MHIDQSCGLWKRIFISGFVVLNILTVAWINQPQSVFDLKERKFELNIYLNPVARESYSRYLARQYPSHDGLPIQRIKWHLGTQRILPPRRDSIHAIDVGRRNHVFAIELLFGRYSSGTSAINRCMATILCPTKRTLWMSICSRLAPDVMTCRSPEPRPSNQCRKKSSWCFSNVIPCVV